MTRTWECVHPYSERYVQNPGAPNLSVRFGQDSLKVPPRLSSWSFLHKLASLTNDIRRTSYSTLNMAGVLELGPQSLATVKERRKEFHWMDRRTINYEWTGQLSIVVQGMHDFLQFTDNIPCKVENSLRVVSLRHFCKEGRPKSIRNHKKQNLTELRIWRLHNSEVGRLNVKIVDAALAENAFELNFGKQW